MIDDPKRYVLRNSKTNEILTDGAETPKIFCSIESAARVSNLQENPTDWDIKPYFGPT